MLALWSSAAYTFPLPHGHRFPVSKYGLLKEREGSPERAAYIERLRQLVKSGEYHVDAEALARKLIEIHLPESDEK